MPQADDSTDWRATATALLLLAAIITFAVFGDHSKDKAWTSMTGKVQSALSR